MTRWLDDCARRRRVLMIALPIATRSERWWWFARVRTGHTSEIHSRSLSAPVRRRERTRVRSPPVNNNYVISLLVCAVRFCELRPRAPGRQDLRQRDVGDDKVGKKIDSSSPLSFTLFSLARFILYTCATPTAFRSVTVGRVIKYWHRSVVKKIACTLNEPSFHYDLYTDMYTISYYMSYVLNKVAMPRASLFSLSINIENYGDAIFFSHLPTHVYLYIIWFMLKSFKTFFKFSILTCRILLYGSKSRKFSTFSKT